MLAVVVAIGLAVVLRRAAPPEPIRLLPGAEGYVYVDLRPLRLADLKIAKPPLDPEYEQFIKDTGFDLERDLNQIATAVHAGAANGENRFTHILDVRISQEKVRRALLKSSARVDSYRDIEIYNFNLQDRTGRVAILGPDLAVASNVDDPLVIRGVIDRFKKLASPFGGPKLVRHYYRKVPIGSLAWAILDIAHDSQQNKSLQLPGGFDLFFPPNTVAVASVRYLGEINFKVEAITPDENAAKRVTDQVNAFLALFHMLETNASGSDPDVKQFFDSLRVAQDGNEAVLTAELPKGFIKKILTEPPPEPQVGAPAQEPRKPAPKKKPQRKK